MMKWFPWGLFVCALLVMFYLFFLLLNSGAAIESARTEVDRLNDRSDLALAILQKEWIGRDASKLVDLSQRFEKEGLVVKHETDKYEIGDIIFEMKNGVVVSVRYFD